MSLRFGILGLLNYSSMTGYDLKKVFDASIDFFWHAQTSQIYRELNVMEEEGWLISHVEIQTDKPNKRIYEITDKGREALMEWIASAPKEDRRPKLPTLMRMFFAGERSVEENIAFFEDYIKRSQAWLDKMDKIDLDLKYYTDRFSGSPRPLYWEMTLDYGIQLMQMNRDWAKKNIEILKKLPAAKDKAEATD